MCARGAGIESVFLAAGRRAITDMVMGEREGRQPAFPSRRPEFVGGGEGIGRVEGAEIDLDFVVGTGKHRAAATRAEVAVVVARRVAGNGHRGLREDGIAGKECTGVFAAIEAMAEPDAIGGVGGGEGYGAAEAGGGGHGGLGVGTVMPARHYLCQIDKGRGLYEKHSMEMRSGPNLRYCREH